MMKIPEADDRLPCRRSVLLGGFALGAAVLAGCSRSESQATATPNHTSASGKPAAAPRAAMTVYRDPSCGCCEAWARIARDAGHEVDLRDDPNMQAVKQRLGVPAQLASCHTTEVGGYVVEGHVPLDQVDRLLRDRPSGVRGIAVPGMPIGSPGMEVSDGSTEPFQVLAFDAAGRASVFKG
jgi:hypothetical protein